jgi:hypothetical protein
LDQGVHRRKSSHGSRGRYPGVHAARGLVSPTGIFCEQVANGCFRVGREMVTRPCQRDGSGAGTTPGILIVKPSKFPPLEIKLRES